MTDFPGSGEPHVHTWSGDPAACTVSAFRDRVPGWISFTQRGDGVGVESPEHTTTIVEIRGDGSFRAYLDHSDDGHSYNAIEEGRLRPPSHFDACMPRIDDIACMLDYAEPASVESEQCR